MLRLFRAKIWNCLLSPKRGNLLCDVNRPGESGDYVKDTFHAELPSMRVAPP